LILKPIQPLTAEPRSSPGNTVGRTIQPGGDIDVLHPLRRVQDHPRALHHPERQRDRARPPLQLVTLILGKLNHILAGPRHDTQFCAPPTIPPNNPQDLRTRPLAAQAPSEARKDTERFDRTMLRHEVGLPVLLTDAEHEIIAQADENTARRLAVMDVFTDELAALPDDPDDETFAAACERAVQRCGDLR
jgi:hypothetical protein